LATVAEPGRALRVTEDQNNKQETNAVYQLAYLESQRNLAQQATVLDNIRTRAGLVIAAANVVTAFLGAPAIRNATTVAEGSTAAPGLALGSWLALASFVVVGVCSIAMLWPRKGWNFRFGADNIIERIDNHPDETLASIQKKLALWNETSFQGNEEKIGELFRLLEIAAFSLFLEACFWLSALSGLTLFGFRF
jgi:hypothetical protein